MRARLLLSPQGLRRAALPIAGARERDRVAVALADLGEMGERGRGIVEEAQSDPAGGELVLGPVVFLARNGGIACDAIGRLEVAEVEQLAGNEPALDPPLVGIDGLRMIGRHGQDQLAGLGRPVSAAEKLDVAENVADIAMRFPRHCVEQRLGVARPF